MSFVANLLFCRPENSLVRLRHLRDPFIKEALHALPPIGFRRVDVAFGIRGDAVNAIEFAGLTTAFTECRQNLQRLPIDDVHAIILPIGKIDVLLLRILGESDIPNGAGAERAFFVELFLNERSIGLRNCCAGAASGS